MQTKQTLALYARNIIFGIQDSLVSTVGLLSGVAVAGTSKSYIIIAGIILIFVEATSMGAGSYISEHSAEHLLKKEKVPLKRYFQAGFLMFISYFIAGFIPLAPYFFAPIQAAFVLSIIFALIALFLLGLLSARYFKIKWHHHALEVLVFGAVAIGIGVVVGLILNNYFNI